MGKSRKRRQSATATLPKVSGASPLPDRSRDYAIAAIHASLISIFIAALVSFMLALNPNTPELRSQIVNKASEVDELSFGKGVFLQDRKQAYPVDASLLLDELSKLLRLPSQGTDSVELGQRGQRAHEILSLVSNFYPYTRRRPSNWLEV